MVLWCLLIIAGVAFSSALIGCSVLYFIRFRVEMSKVHQFEILAYYAVFALIASFPWERCANVLVCNMLASARMCDVDDSLSGGVAFKKSFCMDTYVY